MEEKKQRTFYGYTLKQFLCCIACYCVFFSFGGTDASKSVYLPLIQQYYHLGYDYQGLFVFTSCLGYTLFSLVIGYLLKRLGIKWTLFIGVAILIVAFLCGIVVPNVWLVLAALVVGGVGQVFLDVGTNTWATMLFTSHKAVMMNLLHCFYGFGATVGPTLTGAISKKLEMSYRGTFIAILILLALAIVVVLFIPKQDESQPTETAEAKITETVEAKTAETIEAQSVEANPKSSMTILSALKHPVVILLGLAQGCIAGTESITTNWAPIYLRDLYGWDPQTKGAYFVTVFFTGYTISRLLSGFLIDAVGEINSLIIVLPILIVVYIVGFALGERGTYVLMSTGVFVAPLFPTLLTVAMIYFGKDVETCTCVILFTYMVFSQTIQLIVGLVCRYCGVQWGYRIVVILMTIVFCVLFFVKSHLKKKMEQERETLLDKEVVLFVCLETCECCVLLERGGAYSPPSVSSPLPSIRSLCVVASFHRDMQSVDRVGWERPL